MGLRETIQSATAAAFTAVGGLTVAVEYRSRGVSTLDTTNGVTERWLVYTDINAIQADYKEMEVDGENILPRDQKLLIAAVLVTFTPKAGDEVVIPNGTDLENWKVMGRDLDPAGALHVLQIRRIQ